MISNIVCGDRRFASCEICFPKPLMIHFQFEFHWRVPSRGTISVGAEICWDTDATRIPVRKFISNFGGTGRPCMNFTSLYEFHVSSQRDAVHPLGKHQHFYWSTPPESIFDWMSIVHMSHETSTRRRRTAKENIEQ